MGWMVWRPCIVISRCRRVAIMAFGPSAELGRRAIRSS